MLLDARCCWIEPVTTGRRWFQSVEIGARDVLGYDVFVPWEWGGEDYSVWGERLQTDALRREPFAPCRSVAFAALAAHAPRGHAARHERERERVFLSSEKLFIF